MSTQTSQSISLTRLQTIINEEKNKQNLSINISMLVGTLRLLQTQIQNSDKFGLSEKSVYILKSQELEITSKLNEILKNSVALNSQNNNTNLDFANYYDISNEVNQISSSFSNHEIEVLNNDLKWIKELSNKIASGASSAECFISYNELSQKRKDEIGFYIWVSRGAPKASKHSKIILTANSDFKTIFSELKPELVCLGKVEFLEALFFANEQELQYKKFSVDYEKSSDISILKNREIAARTIKERQLEVFNNLHEKKSLYSHLQLHALFKSYPKDVQMELPKPPYYGHGVQSELYKTLGAHPNANGNTIFRLNAPNAKNVTLILTEDGKDKHFVPMQKSMDNYWVCEAHFVQNGRTYIYEIETQTGEKLRKIDPYGFQCVRFGKADPSESLLDFETRVSLESQVANPFTYKWGDKAWMAERSYNKPCNIYEVYPAFWRKGPQGQLTTYLELADVNNPNSLLNYCKQMKYTHVEMMGILEHPKSDSWGYRVSGFFAPSYRMGSLQDFQKMVDLFHQNGIGIILDWIPAHMAKEDFALAKFDGSAFFEDSHPDRAEYPEWKTLAFDFAKQEVRDFLISSAHFWLDQHIDGLRIDAVAPLFDFGMGRKGFVANHKGNHLNLDAIRFCRELTTLVHEKYPEVHIIAEDSHNFPHLTMPPKEKYTKGRGVGFTRKQAMGCQADILSALYAPLENRHDLYNIANAINFGDGENVKTVMLYSHDEFAQNKGTMFEKMPGDPWKKFAGIRLAISFLMCRPGFKLNFAGNEIGQKNEWSRLHLHSITYPQKSHLSAVEWDCLNDQEHGRFHKGIQELTKELNHLYLAYPALHKLDMEGFKWIDATDNVNKVFSYHRADGDGEQLAIVHNFSHEALENYEINLPDRSYSPELDNLETIEEIFSSDLEKFGGSGITNTKINITRGEDNRPIKIQLRIPPLGTLILKEEFKAPASKPGKAEKSDSDLPVFLRKTSGESGQSNSMQSPKSVNNNNVNIPLQPQETANIAPVETSVNTPTLPASLHTQVKVNYDVGINNTLAIRGEPDWSINVHFTKNEDGWTGQVPVGNDWKFVILHNDQVIKWEKGSNRRCNKETPLLSLNSNEILFD